MRRLRRWIVRGLLALAAAGALGLLGLELTSRTARARDLLRVRATALLAAATGADVAIAAVEASPLGRSLVVHDLALTLQRKPLLRVSRIEMTYSPLALLHRRLLLTRVALTGLRLRAVRDASGWRLPPRSEGGGGGGGMPVEIAELRIEDGRVALALLDTNPTRRLGATAIDLAASGGVEADRWHLTVRNLRFVPRGIALSPVTAAGSVAAGPDGVSLPGAWLTTVASRVDATARVERGGRVSARLALAPLSARDLRALVPSVRLRADATATLTAEGSRDALALRADVDAGPGGRLAISGTVDAQSVPLRYAATAHFADVDPGGAIEGLVRARAGGRLRVRGRGTDRRATLAYGVELERSEIAGRAVDRFVLAGRGRRGVHHVRSRLSAAGGDELTVHAAAVLEPVPLYRARGRLRLPRLQTIVPGSPGWAHARVGVKGRGTDPRERHVEMVATLAGAEVCGIPLDRGLVRADVSGMRVRLTEALVEGPELTATSSGTLDLDSRAAEASLQGTANLSGLGARLGTPLGGTAILHAHAAGPPQSVVAEATMTIKDPRYGTFSGDEMTAQLDWRRGGDADRARLAADLRGHEGRAGRVALAIVRTPARITGEIAELTMTPDDGPSWHLDHAANFTYANRLEITDLTLVAAAERVALTARAGPSGPADGVLTCEHVRLDRLCSLAGAPRCAGEVSGRVRLAGAAEAPRLEAELVAAGLSVEEAQYGDLQAHATYAPRALAVQAGLRYPRAGDLHLDGTVPIDLAWAGSRRDTSGESLRVEVGAERLDLAFLHALAPGQVRESHGLLSAKLRLQGPRAAPRADGFVTVEGGRFELGATGVAYENVRLRLRGANTGLELEELRAEAGDGTVDGTGRVTLSGLQPTDLDLKLGLHDFLAIRQSAYEAVLTGPLTLGGTVTDPVLTGDLEVSRAVVHPASLPVSKPALHPDPTIEVAGTPDVDGPPPESSSAVAEALALSLRVHIARNAWIRRVDANIELGGDVKVEKRPHAPVGLDGTIRLLRGWYTFQGRRFTVEDGAILFHGEAPPKPTFDVTASYRASQYRVEVHVSGSAEKPTLTLTSDPPLEQADILAVILFGKPTHELGRAESTTLQQQAVQLGAGYVTPELQASVMNALGLDTLDVALPQGSAPGAVRAGRYVAQDVFVSLGQEFGKNAAQVVGVEYGLTRNVSVKASTSSRGASAIDLFWHRRY